MNDRNNQPARNKFVDKVDAAFGVIADWAIRRRLLVVACAVALLVAGGYLSTKAQLDNSMTSYFDKSDPTYIAYNEYLQDFFSDEITYILYRIPDREYGPFDLEAMRTIGQLTEALEAEVPFVRDATSLANVEFIRAEGDTINVDELLIDFPETQEQLLQIRDVVLSKPLYVDYLINNEANYATIILEMDRTSADPIDRLVYDPELGEAPTNLYPLVSDIKIREILARPEYQGIEFFLSGDVAMNATYSWIIPQDTSIIMGTTLLLLVLVSMLMFRATWAGILGPLSVVILSTILTIALVAAIGWKLGMLFIMVPTLLCAVGVAQSVHILLEFQRNYAENGDRNAAVKAALSKVGGPCLMAALTTAAGFLVMQVSELQGLSQLAVYASAGVIFTFLLSTTLLVVFLAGKDNTNVDQQRQAARQRRMQVRPQVLRVVRFCIQVCLSKTPLVLVVSLIFAVLALAGVRQLTVDFNFLKEFKPHVEYRQHTELVEEVMGGGLSLAYIIDTKTPDGIKDPALLQALENVQRFAEQQPLVKKTFSVTDIVKDLNQSFHGDNPQYHRLPAARDLVSQYLLVYELSGGEDMEDFVSGDFSRTVLELRIEMTESTKLIELVEVIDSYLEQNPIPGAEVRKTGIGLLWMVICQYIADTQLLSYSLVFAMIALFMCISFGSIKVGLLSMIPNLAPVVAILGFMGWFDVNLDYMKLLLATIAIGIAVDDTIHLVTRYRSRFLQTGNYRLALEKALNDVGPALVVTTMILMVAFSSYLLSETTVLASFGVLLAGAVFVALLADLFLMPALILTFKPFGPEFVAEEVKEESVEQPMQVAVE